MGEVTTSSSSSESENSDIEVDQQEFSISDDSQGNTEVE